MFTSFFPRPKAFFLSAIIWISFCIAVHSKLRASLGPLLSLDVSDQAPVIGLNFFVTDAFLFFYLYFAFACLIFVLFWFIVCPHKWQRWSVSGSCLLLFFTYIAVQLQVAVNVWERPFGDTLQNALTGDKGVTQGDMYGLFADFAGLAAVAVVLFVATRYFASHYIFRWRQAMNDHYTERWQRIRRIEGASQRVQEDTMRFSKIMEDLGVTIVESVMTLIAFLPVLWSLSKHVTELPIIGQIDNPLLVVVVAWSIFGTLLLMLVGFRLPGLEFHNQRVEAAYRKELVYGEDRTDRAHPATLRSLFLDVRNNYFRLYFHYLYFNFVRQFYLRADNIFVFLIMIPTFVSGTITYGIYAQILSAFRRVSEAFNFLINSWPTIIELLSVMKRLAAFDREIEDTGQQLSGEKSAV